MLSDDIWPSLTGEEPEPPRRIIVVGPSPAEQATPTISPAARRVPLPPFAAAPPISAPAPWPSPAPLPVAETTLPPGATGTFVGTKVVQHLRELDMLRSSLGTADTRYQQLRGVAEQDAQRYYAIIAAISARLQLGTTPGNPVLVSQWNTAQAELDRILTDIAALNTLANDIASQAALSAYLSESIRAAYGLSGAVEQDHRQLAQLEDEINRTTVHLDRLLNDVSDTVTRHTAYANNERRNLTTLSLSIKNGEMFGPPLASRAYAPATLAPRRQAAAPGQARQPLVVIRFDRPDVPYMQALYTAVSQALEQRPAAAFDVVSIVPNKGTPAQVALKTNESKRNAERVFRSLSEMGLPGDRVTLSTTTSTMVHTNEVHLYVR